MAEGQKIDIEELLEKEKRLYAVSVELMHAKNRNYPGSIRHEAAARLLRIAEGESDENTPPP